MWLGMAQCGRETYYVYIYCIYIRPMSLPFEPPEVSGELRKRLAVKRPNFPQINYIARTIHAIERAEQPVAKLPQGALSKWGLTPQVAEWPCSNFASVVRALKDPLEGPIWAVSRLFRDIAVVEHLRDGRDMRAELQSHFRGHIPFAFVALAVDAGRAGVLRPFGIRPGKQDVTAEDIRYANRLFGIAMDVYDELRARLAAYEIAWPCHYCGRPHLEWAEGYCCEECQASDERRATYVNRRDRPKSKKAGARRAAKPIPKGRGRRSD